MSAIRFAIASKPFRISPDRRAEPGDVLDVSGWRQLDAYIGRGLIAPLPNDPEALRRSADQLEEAQKAAEVEPEETPVKSSGATSSEGEGSTNTDKTAESKAPAKKQPAKKQAAKKAAANKASAAKARTKK